MSRIKIPKPPHHGPLVHAIVQKGVDVTLIWVFDPTGRASIDTQYKTATALQALYGLSRATAYRLIARQSHRWWLFDYTDPARPVALSCIPTETAQDYIVQPVGNPNFSNGIYQQSIARRRKPRGVILTD